MKKLLLIFILSLPSYIYSSTYNDTIFVNCNAQEEKWYYIELRETCNYNQGVKNSIMCEAYITSTTKVKREFPSVIDAINYFGNKYGYSLVESYIHPSNSNIRFYILKSRKPYSGKTFTVSPPTNNNFKPIFNN